MSDHVTKKDITKIFLEIQRNLNIKMKKILISDLIGNKYKNTINDLEENYVCNDSILDKINDKIKAQLKILNGKRYSKKLILAALKLHYVEGFNYKQIESLFSHIQKNFL